ncbi:MAG: radical SAM protein [Candidatus Asgardarchaeum californiense]|nr:MAG: radical SAM protein [Candidatus Asgardarchaeum californiense]
MVRYILATDRTLSSKYRNIPLGDFLGCIPSERVPRFIFDFIAKVEPPLNTKGVARVAPYGLRKIEAALLEKGIPRKDIVVAHPSYLHNFIDNETKIVGIYTMDPLGFGPVSMMFCVGGKYTPYDALEFEALLNRLNEIRQSKGYKFKIVVGGPGAWQLSYKIERARELQIDHIVIGETEHIIDDIFEDIENDDAPEIIHVRNYPKIDQIPEIVGASLQGLVEVMRGCGRGCDFCLPNLRAARYMPLEKITSEISTNVKFGERGVWIHSEDIFLYKLEDHKTFIPNRDAVLELFNAIINVPGVHHAHPTHASIAAIAADPEMIQKSSEILRASPYNWIGIQPGLETGSGDLLVKHMPNKIKPFSADEWSDVVIEATAILNQNYWFPAYTIIIGLPGETDDDALATLELLERLETEVPQRVGPEKTHFIAAPLSFVPLAALKHKNMFNIEQEITEARFQVIYKAWQIIVREAHKSLNSLVNQPLPIKATINLIMRFGGHAILRNIEKFGLRHGFTIPRKSRTLTIAAR